MSEILEYIMSAITSIFKRGLEYFGLFYSKYRGFVVDNNDPEGMGRIKVIVPIINPKVALETWAYPTGMYAGDGFGCRVLPPKNSVVWVEFEQGRSRAPLWTHGHFAKNEMPEGFSDPNKMFFCSPQGHVVLIDDTNNIIRLSIFEGPTFEVNTEGISIGSETESNEPAVKGDSLQGKLSEIINVLKTMKIKTSLGPQGILPNFIESLNSIEESLGDIKSNDVTLN